MASSVGAGFLPHLLGFALAHRMPREAARIVCVAALAGANFGGTAIFGSSQAQAGELMVRARTSGESYAVIGVGSNPTPILRRRIAQYIDLGVYDLLPPTQANQFYRDADEGQLRWQSSLRIRHDFGPWERQAQGQAATLIDAVDNRQLDLLYGYLEGTNFARSIDFRVGRQFEGSALDFFAFDGGWLRLRAPVPGRRLFALELFGGAQANAASLLGYASFERDGVDPELTGKRAPMFGAALATADTRRVQARLAYRRIVSSQSEAPVENYLRDFAGARRLWAIEEQVISATAGIDLVPAVANLNAAARYNLATGRMDQAMASFQWQPTPVDLLRLSYSRAIFAFDSDSIFNVFDLKAFEDVRVQMQRTFADGWRLGSRSQVRIDRADKPRFGAGFGATLSRRVRHLSGTGDIDVLTLERVTRLAATADLRYFAWADRVRITARMLYMQARDRSPLRRDELGLFFQTGIDAQLWRQVSLGVSAEEGSSNTVRHSLRVLAMLSIDWNMRLGAR